MPKSQNTSRQKINKLKVILAYIEEACGKIENNLGLNQRRIRNQQKRKVKYITFFLGGKFLKLLRFFLKADTLNII